MQIEHPTYYDENKDTDYPFESGASRSNGDAVIAQDAFVDARLFPPSGRHDIFISSIEVGENIVITLSDRSGVLGTGSFTRDVPPDFVTFHTTSDVYLGILVGTPTTGLSKISGWPSGTYAFSITQTRFAATAVVPQPQEAVRAIQLDSGALFHDDVTLVAEKGIQLTIPNLGSSSSGFANKCEELVRFDVVGDPLFRRRGCEEEGATTNVGQVLQSIVLNGDTINPDTSGRFNVVLGSPTGNKSALRILPENYGLRIEFLGSNV